MPLKAPQSSRFFASTKSRVLAAAIAVLAVGGVTAGIASLPSDPWSGSVADDGALMDGSYMYLANQDSLEPFVELGDNESMPWAVLSTDPHSSTLFIAYVASVGDAPSCGSHLGVSITERADAVMIAAVSAKADSGASCGTEQIIGGGYFELSRPVGERALVHAKTSGQWASIDPELDTYYPEPVPVITPTAAPYSGDATCTNLLGSETKDELGKLDLTDLSESFTVNVAEQPALDVYEFLDHGGIVCGWGDSLMRYAYAYGPITAAEAEASRDYLRSEGATESEANGVAVFTVAEYASTYAFGDGYWAVSIDLGAGEFVPAVKDAASPGGTLTQIVANAPVF